MNLALTASNKREEAQNLLDADRGVFFAGNAEHAKSLMRSIGTGISVVMIDLDLPGQDGFSLMQEMRKHFPDLPVIAISGVFPTARSRKRKVDRGG